MTEKVTLLKGKEVADKVKEELILETNNLKSAGISPKLTIIRVGKREDDLAYERGAVKRCEAIGIETNIIELDSEIKEEDFLKILSDVNDDKSTNGILLFRPLPKQLNEDVIKYQISPEKDIDCFSPVNIAKLMEGDKSGFNPCTPTAVIEMIKHFNIEIEGKKVVVLGRSMVVGKPVSMMLLNENATVTICHSKTHDLKEVTKEADILVVAVGRAKMVKEDFVKEGAVVIDVGINVDENGKLCGDVDFELVENKASMITPVPGGVGAVTTTVLAKHIIRAAKAQNNI